MFFNKNNSYLEGETVYSPDFFHKCVLRILIKLILIVDF